jgi:hypothetical protein
VDFGARDRDSDRLAKVDFGAKERHKTICFNVRKFCCHRESRKSSACAYKSGFWSPKESQKVDFGVTKTVYLTVQKRILVPDRVTKPVCLSEKIDFGARKSSQKQSSWPCKSGFWCQRGSHKNRLFERTKADFVPVSATKTVCFRGKVDYGARESRKNCLLERSTKRTRFLCQRESQKLSA